MKSHTQKLVSFPAVILCSALLVMAQSGRHMPKQTEPAPPSSPKSSADLSPTGVRPETSLLFGNDACTRAGGARSGWIVRVERALFHPVAGRVWHEEAPVLSSSATYDADGNLLKSLDYSPDGSVNRSVFYEYDKQGKLIGESTFGVHRQALFQRLFTYDTAGDLKEETVYNPDGSIKYTTVTVYGSQRTRIKSVRYSRAGYVTSSRTYNSRGELEEETTFTRKNVVDYKTVFEYDVQGNKTLEAYYTGAGKLLNQQNPNHSKSVYRYDGNGNLVEETDFKPNGSASWRTVYDYDNKGNIVEESHFYRGTILNSKRSYDYQFNRSGNWIRKTVTDEPADPTQPSRPLETVYRFSECQ
jgi:YD repeat-containing protein